MIVVLNGPSSSGKSSIADALGNEAPGHWLKVSIDDFVRSLPSRLTDDQECLRIGSDGTVHTGPLFTRLLRAWLAGVGAIAGAGVNVVYDDVLLDPVEGQKVLRGAFKGNEVFWVAVECAPDVLVAREATRKDRPKGMAATQLSSVDDRFPADFRVATHMMSPIEAALRIVAALEVSLGPIP